jgi:hypothetical protein
MNGQSNMIFLLFVSFTTIFCDHSASTVVNKDTNVEWILIDHCLTKTVLGLTFGRTEGCRAKDNSTK